MRTERDLDAQLHAARGFSADDVPALPTAFLDYLRTADAHSDGDAADSGHPTSRFIGSDTRASVLAAKQLVSDAQDRRLGSSPRQRRRPRGRLAVRLGAAVVAVAVVWATAVTTAPSSSGPATPGLAATPSSDAGTQAGGAIELVSVETLMFPLSLDPAPAGLTPSFSQRGNESSTDAQPEEYVADYRSKNAATTDVIDGQGGFTLFAWPEDPRGQINVELAPDQYDSIERETVTVDSSPARLVHASQTTDEGTATYTDLFWQLPSGWWVRILGDGVYNQTVAILAVAESVVDRPQALGLQFGLAPAGWSASSYEESHSVDLINDANPDQLLRLSVYTPGPGTTIEGFYEDLPEVFVSPATPVTIMGLPGLIALRAGDAGYPPYWYVTGHFTDGRIFLLLAPDVLTQEQVLRIADQIVYT